jgi:polar amino acid transport system substrate-binding protein
MYYRFTIYLLVLYGLLSSPAALSSPNKLTATVPSFAPFYFVTDKKKCLGVAANVLKQITDQISLPVEIKSFPYARIIRSLDAGALDLALIFKNNTLADSVEYIGPVSQSKVLIVTALDTPIRKYSDLKNLTAIAVIRNAQFEERFDNDGSLKKVSVESYQQGINMFNLGRVDGVIGSLVGLDYELRVQHLNVKMLDNAFQLGKKEWWLHLSNKTSTPLMLSELSLAVTNIYQPSLIYQTYLKHIKDCQVNN